MPEFKEDSSQAHTHTHCLEVSLCLEGNLFAIGFTFDLEFKNSSNFHGVLCALVANWPNEMHLPPDLGRYIYHVSVHIFASAKGIILFSQTSFASGPQVQQMVTKSLFEFVGSTASVR